MLVMPMPYYNQASLISGVFLGVLVVAGMGVPQGTIAQTAQSREAAAPASASVEVRGEASAQGDTAAEASAAGQSDSSSGAQTRRMNKAELIDAIAKGSKLTAVSEGNTSNEVMITLVADADAAQKGVPQGGYIPYHQQYAISADDVRDAILEILQDNAFVARGIEKKDIWRGMAEALDAGARKERIAPQAQEGLAEAAQAIQRVIIHEGTKDPNQNAQQRVIIHEGTKDPNQPTQQRVIIHEGTKDPNQNAQTKRVAAEGGGSVDPSEAVTILADFAPADEGNGGEVVVVDINTLARADAEAKAQVRARFSSIDAVTTKNDLGMFLALTALEDPHILSASVVAPAQENGKEKPSVVVATRGEADAQVGLIDSVLGSGRPSTLVVDTEVRVLGVFKKKARARVEAECADDGSNCTTSVRYDLPWYLRLISWKPSLSAYASLSAQVARKAAQLGTTATTKVE